MTTDKIKTGTTCIGLLFKDGVLLAADRRVTAGYIASDRAEKIYEVSSAILATTAGHAADNQKVMRIIKGELKLLELRKERTPKVKEAAMILNSMQYSIIRTQGGIVSLILGGYDSKEGFSLYNLSPDGTILPHDGYVVDGSGSVYIKAIFDNEYNPNLSRKEALEIVEKAFKTSFMNDNASGGGFIAKIVTDKGVIETVESKILKTEFIKS